MVVTLCSPFYIFPYAVKYELAGSRAQAVVSVAVSKVQQFKTKVSALFVWQTDHVTAEYSGSPAAAGAGLPSGDRVAELGENLLGPCMQQGRQPVTFRSC